MVWQLQGNATPKAIPIKRNNVASHSNKAKEHIRKIKVKYKEKAMAIVVDNNVRKQV